MLSGFLWEYLTLRELLGAKQDLWNGHLIHLHSSCNIKGFTEHLTVRSHMNVIISDKQVTVNFKAFRINFYNDCQYIVIFSVAYVKSNTFFFFFLTCAFLWVFRIITLDESLLFCFLFSKLDQCWLTCEFKVIVFKTNEFAYLNVFEGNFVE